MVVFIGQCPRQMTVPLGEPEVPQAVFGILLKSEGILPRLIQFVCGTPLAHGQPHNGERGDYT